MVPIQQQICHSIAALGGVTACECIIYPETFQTEAVNEDKSITYEEYTRWEFKVLITLETAAKPGAEMDLNAKSETCATTASKTSRYSQQWNLTKPGSSLDGSPSCQPPVNPEAVVGFVRRATNRVRFTKSASPPNLLAVA